MEPRDLMKIYHELGRLSVSWSDARALMEEAKAAAGGDPSTTQVGKVEIPGTKKLLVFTFTFGRHGNSWTGIWSIEDVPPMTADQLVRKAVQLIDKHNRSSYAGGGPNFYEWLAEARRYITSQEA